MLKNLSAEQPNSDQSTIKQRLSDATDAVIIVGNDAQRSSDAAAIRACALALSEQTGAALVLLPDQANSVGAWLSGAVPHRTVGGADVDRPGFTAAQMLSGAAKTYLVYDFEPALDTAAGSKSTRSLAAAAGVVYIGAYATDEIRQIADVILPLSAHPEADGTFVNLNGRVQSVAAASKSPGDARSGWKILRVLGNELALDGFDYVRIQQVRDELSAAIDDAPCVPGAAEPTNSAGAVTEGELELIRRVPIYACDAVVRRAEALQGTVLGETAHIALNPEDADRLSLTADTKVRVTLGDEEISLPLTVTDTVPAGAAYLPAGVIGSEGVGDAASAKVSAA